MPNLPDVFVTLKANSSQFMAAMQQAQSEIKKTADTTQSASDRMQSVGKVAFAGLSAAAIGFGAIAVKAALDGQQAHAQLVQAVQNSGTAFSTVGGQVDDMSARFAKFGFENDQVEEALTNMVRATGSVSQSMKEMGLAADIARARHQDLAEVATGLGKIMEGNTKPMAGFGLSAKDAAGNTLTAAQAVKELTDRFGGAAQANAGTYAGKLQAMNAEFKNAEEAIGNMLLPVLGDLAGGLADVANWFERHRAAAVLLASVIGGPLVVAMSSFIAKQVVAFAGSAIEWVTSMAGAVMTSLVPALEALAISEEAAATAESFLTFGLSAAAGVAGVLAIKQALHVDSTKDVAAASGDASTTVQAFNASETEAGATVDDTTSKLKSQQKQFEDLAGSTNAQNDLILKIIGDYQAVADATDKATTATGKDSEASKWAAQHTKDLKQADDDLKQATQAVTDAVARQTTAQQKLNDLLKPQTQRNITDAANAHTAANDRLTRANIGVTDKTKALNEAIGQYGRGSEEATLAQLDLNDALREVTSAQEDVEDTSKTLDDAQRQTIGTTDEITQATSDLTTANGDVADATGKQTTAQQKLHDVQGQDNSAAVAADRKTLQENTMGAATATQRLRDDMQSLQDLLGLPGGAALRAKLIADVQALSSAFPGLDKTGPLKDIIGALTGPIPPNSLLSTLQSPQALTPAINGLNAAVQNSSLQSFFLVGGALASPGTQGAVNNTPLQGTHGGLPSGSAVPPAAGSSPVYLLPAFGVPGKAAGGPVLPGGTYLVGEQGPELLRMGSSAGTVVPNGAGGMNVTVNIVGNGRDDQELAYAVRDELLKIGARN